MRLSEIIQEGRTDAFSLPQLAKRHFGADTSIENKGSQVVVIPAKPDRAAMIGFMGEVKHLGMTARWEPSVNGFVVV